MNKIKNYNSRSNIEKIYYVKERCQRTERRVNDNPMEQNKEIPIDSTQRLFHTIKKHPTYFQLNAPHKACQATHDLDWIISESIKKI
jgi:hypothetical protein